MLLADCRGANPRPGATAAPAGGGSGRSPGAGAVLLRPRGPSGRRFRADRASSQVILAVPRRGCHRCPVPHTRGESPRCGGAREGLLVPPSFSGDKLRGCAVRCTPPPPAGAVDLFVLFIYLFERLRLKGSGE